MLIELSHEQEKAIRYVDRARSTDKTHPVLQAVNSNGIMETADGHRYHAVNTQIDYEGLLSYGKPGAVLQAEPEAGTFPDIARIIPKEEPAMVIVLDSRFLRDALAGLEQYVTLRIYSPTKPMEVMGHAAVKRGSDSPETYALIMPVHSSPETQATWRPHQDTPEDAPEDN